MSLFLRSTPFAALVWSALLGSATLSLHADKKSAPPPLEHKDYTLFMGANFQIMRDRKLYPVVDVVGDSFVIKVNGERVLVPIDRGDLKLRVDEALKLTPEEVPVRDLTTDRAYTPARDPRKKFIRESEAMMDVQDVQTQTLNAEQTSRQFNAMSNGTGPAQGMNPSARAQALASAQAQNVQAQSTLQSARSTALNMQYGSAAFAGQMQDELAKELFDAMEITFKVSSTKPLSRPYVIVVARYRNPDDRPNEARNWIFAKQINPVGEHERTEHFLQGGLMPGFTLISTEFHLYNEGKEIATEVAHKRVALTREEAFEYSMIEYIGAHKGQSVEPTPAMATLPSDFLTHLSEDQVQGTFYVKVGADGKASEVYKDEACTIKEDNPYLADGLRKIWFEPALEKGRPIAGVAKVHPNRLHFAIETKI